MRKFGSVVEFGPQRDRELWLAFLNNLHLAARDSSISPYQLTADSPCSRFWVSEKRAAAVICMMIKGISISFMSPLKQEMFREIFQRFLEYRRVHPDSSVIRAAEEVVYSPAPKFYLSPKSVRVLISKYNKERRVK